MLRRVSPLTPGEVIQFPRERQDRREEINADLESIGVNFRSLTEAGSVAGYTLLDHLPHYGVEEEDKALFDDFISHRVDFAILPTSEVRFVASEYDLSDTGFFVRYGLKSEASRFAHHTTAIVYIPTVTVRHYEALLRTALQSSDAEQAAVARMASYWVFYNAIAEVVVDVSRLMRPDVPASGFLEWVAQLRAVLNEHTNPYIKPLKDEHLKQYYRQYVMSPSLVFGIGIDMLINYPVSDFKFDRLQAGMDRLVGNYQAELGGVLRTGQSASTELLARAAPANLVTLKDFFTAVSHD